MSNTEILLTIKLQQQLFVDPKRITLLKQIHQCGSINQAAKNAQISYKSAWDHLAMMNEISPKPLLERNTGGKNGGGTTLTPYAERLLQLYDLLAKTQEKAFEILQDERITLDSLLSATAKFSPQSSARNQFFGNIIGLEMVGGHCNVCVEIANFSQKMTACITQKSAERLKLAIAKEVMLMIKAPWIELHQTQPNSVNTFVATVSDIQHTGESQEATLQLAEGLECYATFSQSSMIQGQQVWITIDPNQIILLTL